MFESNLESILNKSNNLSMPQSFQVMNMMRNYQGKANLEELKKLLIEEYKILDTDLNSLSKINNSMLQEVRSATKTNPFKPLSEQEQDINQFRDVLTGQHFIKISYEITRLFHGVYKNLIHLCNNLIPEEIYQSKQNISYSQPDSTKELQEQLYEYQLNKGSVNKFTSALLELDSADTFFLENLEGLVRLIEQYYTFLQDRHSKQGVKVFNSPILTDIAYAIFANIDAHGEIQSGVKIDDVSAFTINKGITVIECTKNNIVKILTKTPDSFTDFIKYNINLLADYISKIKDLNSKEITTLKNMLYMNDGLGLNVKHHYNAIANHLENVNPASVRYKDDVAILSHNEKFSKQFEEETIEVIVEKIVVNASPKDILQYIFERKSHLKNHFQNENTFYVCQISAGNPFLGEAPGALKVVPGQKPNVSMDKILGSGFDKVRNFFKAAESSTKWAPLFMATSPSKSADKSNALLIGPQGSGKTELMRSIGTNKDCIAIFAQGSDFLTCWKGEADKNPKRLFQQALKLHKESKKRVYILIDEVDSVMHHPQGHNDINLTLEFQILMDGIVDYPGISLWGATNNPEKIPMPMIRRFNLVEIVGELQSEDRVKLLQMFLSYLPQNNFDKKDWDRASERLEGATGDVLRKICDHIWRSKMNHFVQNYPDAAENILKNFLEIDGAFDINNFDDDKRSNLKNALKQYVSVTPDDLNESISTHMNNMAVRSEIQTAVKTYETARQLLTALN